jgi:hypothetical protein
VSGERKPVPRLKMAQAILLLTNLALTLALICLIVFYMPEERFVLYLLIGLNLVAFVLERIISRRITKKNE